jgi:hypothetical protein
LKAKKDIWNHFLYFFSASSTQKYLKKCYTSANIPDAESKSYENSYPFQYYLEHAQTYYTQASICPLSIQPILTFYGFVQLTKACILSIDPNYPESTAVLAHGVTTRKRKKQQYEFFLDEVKIQKNGLFTYMAEKMFHIKHLEGDKFSMGELMREIPELDHAFEFLSLRKNFQLLKTSTDQYHLSTDILNTLHMTKSRLEEFLRSKTSLTMSIEEAPAQLTLMFPEKLSCNIHSPIHYSLSNEEYVLSMNKDSACYTFPELLHHYLLLYNLGMIARYETEWWSELLKTMPNDDYPFIAQFLNITLTKGPYLIYEWLTTERFIKKEYGE